MKYLDSNGTYKTINVQMGEHSHTASDIISLNDYVIERTYTAPWYITKWKSGKVELSARKTFYSIACSNSWGVMYTGTITGSDISFPLTFSEVPTVNVSFEYNNSNCWIATCDTVCTTSKAPKYQAVRPTSATVAVTLNYYVVGKI